MTKWKQYAPAVGKVMDIEKVTISTGWDEEIEQFLALMKLLPAKSGKAPVLSFIRVVDRLMIHSEVSHELSSKKLACFTRLIDCYS